MKMGVDIRKLKNIAPFLPNVNGNFQFDSIQQMVDNRPTQITVAFGPSTLSYDELDQFYYFQDDWRIRQNLTLNLGVPVREYRTADQPAQRCDDPAGEGSGQGLLAPEPANRRPGQQPDTGRRQQLGAPSRFRLHSAFQRRLPREGLRNRQIDDPWRLWNRL
jgi:hypothetical protein